MKPITRRRFILGLSGAALAASGNGFLIEPRRLVVTRNRINSPASLLRDPRVRIVQITDLHLQRVNGHVRRIAETVNRLRPHLLLLTGDLIDKSDRVSELGRFLSLLNEGPAKFATLGNWEHWGRIDLNQLASKYQEHGCRLLVNETAIVRYKNREVLITGLDDATGGSPHLINALRGVKPGPNHLVVAHSPIFRDVMVTSISRGVSNHDSGEDAEIAKYSFSCVLSGHTHGGQVALFGWAPLRPPGSGKYVSGWYNDASPNLYVSRGLGTSVLPVRFGATPELALFNWRLATTRFGR